MASNLRTVVKFLYPGNGWYYESMSSKKVSGVYHWACGLPYTLDKIDDLEMFVATNYGIEYMKRLNRETDCDTRNVILELVCKILINKGGHKMEKENRVNTGETLYLPKKRERVKVLGVENFASKIRYITLNSNYSDTEPVEAFEPLVELAIEVNQEYMHEQLGMVRVVALDRLANEAIVAEVGKRVGSIRYSVRIKELQLEQRVTLQEEKKYRLVYDDGYVEIYVVKEVNEKVKVITSDLNTYTIDRVLRIGSSVPNLLPYSGPLKKVPSMILRKVE